MRSMTHSVEKLPIHLKNMQSVHFEAGNEDTALQLALQKESKLTAWFKLNSSDPYATQFLYPEVPVHYKWSDNKWIRRKINYKVITRLVHVSPRDRERYHLRVLLLNVPGATSFNDLLTFDNIVYTSFQQVCKARHLIDDDAVWERTLQEAITADSPKQL